MICGLAQITLGLCGRIPSASRLLQTAVTLTSPQGAAGTRCLSAFLSLPALFGLLGLFAVFDTLALSTLFFF
jgi:hypothetical protein